MEKIHNYITYEEVIIMKVMVYNPENHRVVFADAFFEDIYDDDDIYSHTEVDVHVNGRQLNYLLKTGANIYELRVIAPSWWIRGYTSVAVTEHRYVNGRKYSIFFTDKNFPEYEWNVYRAEA